MKEITINNIERNEIIKQYFMHISKTYKYAILHHLENIYDVDGDIDFVIDCNKLEFYMITNEFCEKNNGFIANFFTITENIYKANLAVKVNKFWTTIQLDCCIQAGNTLLSIDTHNIIKNKNKRLFDNYYYSIASPKHEIEYYINKKAYKEINFKYTSSNGIDQYRNYLLSLDDSVTNTQIDNLYRERINYFKTIYFKIKKSYSKLYTLFYRIFEVNSIILVLDIKNNEFRDQVINKLEKNHFFSNVKSIKLANKGVSAFLKEIMMINYFKLQSTLILINSIEERQQIFLGKYLYVTCEEINSINDITDKIFTLIASTMNKQYKEEYGL